MLGKKSRMKFSMMLDSKKFFWFCPGFYLARWTRINSGGVSKTEFLKNGG